MQVEAAGDSALQSSEELAVGTQGHRIVDSSVEEIAFRRLNVPNGSMPPWRLLADNAVARLVRHLT